MNEINLAANGQILRYGIPDALFTDKKKVKENQDNFKKEMQSRKYSVPQKRRLYKSNNLGINSPSSQFS